GRAGAVLGQVADACRRSAGQRARLHAVGRAVLADAVARLGDVADVGRGAADRRALGIRRTRRRRPGAVLRQVAGAGRRAADDRARLEAIGRTVVADPVAGFRRVAEVAGSATDRRALGVARTGVVATVAVLGEVAGAGRRTAQRRALRIVGA